MTTRQYNDAIEAIEMLRKARKQIKQLIANEPEYDRAQEYHRHDALMTRFELQRIQDQTWKPPSRDPKRYTEYYRRFKQEIRDNEHKLLRQHPLGVTENFFEFMTRSFRKTPKLSRRFETISKSNNSYVPMIDECIENYFKERKIQIYCHINYWHYNSFNPTEIEDLKAVAKALKYARKQLEQELI